MRVCVCVCCIGGGGGDLEGHGRSPACTAGGACRHTRGGAARARQAPPQGPPRCRRGPLWRRGAAGWRAAAPDSGKLVIDPRPLSRSASRSCARAASSAAGRGARAGGRAFGAEHGACRAGRAHPAPYKPPPLHTHTHTHARAHTHPQRHTHARAYTHMHTQRHTPPPASTATNITAPLLALTRVKVGDGQRGLGLPESGTVPPIGQLQARQQPGNARREGGRSRDEKQAGQGRAGRGGDGWLPVAAGSCGWRSGWAGVCRRGSAAPWPRLGTAARTAARAACPPPPPAARPPPPPPAAAAARPPRPQPPPAAGGTG